MLHLLHVNDLIVYFINEYPKDQKTILNINKGCISGGDISRAFYNLVMGVCDTENLTNSKKKAMISIPNKIINKFEFFGRSVEGNSFHNNAFSPEEFKRTLGLHNSLFRRFEANDSKDLILYLLQTMHEELNTSGINIKMQNSFIISIICLKHINILLLFIIVIIFQKFLYCFMGLIKTQ